MASEKIPQGKYFSVYVKILLFIHRKVETAGVYFCFVLKLDESFVA